MATDATALPAWMPEAAFWLAALAAFATVAAALGVWTLVARLREVRREGARLAVLEELDQKLGRVLAARDDLDLRRLEHVLIDLRDGQKRMEDLLHASLERAPAGSEAGLLVPQEPASLGERLINRLLAMGYERIQVVTRPEKLVELAHKDGEVLVEARREGVLHKGRVLVRQGRLGDVELHPAYSIFP